MAKIFQINSRTRVPDLSQIVTPTLDIPVMDFASIESALDSFATEEETNIVNAEENFNSLVEIRDELIGERFDNDKQAEVFENAKREVGLDDQAFRVSMDDLRDPFKVRGLRSKLAQIYERSDVRDIEFEKKRGKDYLDKIWALKDMNPGLYKMALNKYNQYRNGEITGFDLLPQEFTPIDVDKTINDALSLLPQIEISDIETKHGLAYEKEVKKRTRAVIDAALKQLEANPIYMNNVRSQFMNEDGTFNQAAYDAYRDRLAEEYAKPYIDFENVRALKTQTEAEKEITNVVDDVLKRGGDIEELDKNKAMLEQAVKGKKLLGVDENDTEVIIRIMTPDGEVEDLSIPKTGSVGSAPATYNMTVGGENLSFQKSDLDAYLEEHPTVDMKNKAPDATFKNKGRKTEAFLKGGELYTNDVGLLRELGLVGADVNFDELESHGFEFEANEDDMYFAKIRVQSDKFDDGEIISEAGDLEDFEITREDIPEESISYGEANTSGFSSVKAKNILNLRPYGKNKKFKTYDSYEDSLRDSVRLLLRYYEGISGPLNHKKDKLWNTADDPVTIEELIRTWSPSFEDCIDGECGDTKEEVVQAYVKGVAEKVGGTPESRIGDIGIVQLSKAMAMHECPKCMKEIEKEYGSWTGLFKKAFNIRSAKEGEEFPGKETEVLPPEVDVPEDTTAGNMFDSLFTTEPE